MADDDKTEPKAPAPAAPPTDTGKPSMSRLWELSKDALAMAVIPLVAWVINLSVENALRDERILTLQSEIASLHEQQKEVQAVKDDLQKANIQMVRLEGKIDQANGRLDEIKSLLR